MTLKRRFHQLFFLIFTILPIGILIGSKTVPIVTHWASVKYVIYVPVFFFLVSCFLSLKIQKTQIFLISIIWLATYLLFLWNQSYNFKHLVFIMPLLITWITMQKTVRFFSRHMLFQLISTIVVMIGGYYISIYLVNPQAKFLILFVKNMQAAQWLKFWKLPSLMFFTVPFLFLISLNFKHKALDLFFPASWLSIFPMFYLLNYEEISSTKVVVTFVGIGLLILYSIYQYFLTKVYKDELTNVLNRRALDERLETLHDHFSIAMMDVDHFKKFNDTYGHKEGDNVLRFVAQFISENLHVPVYRYGGEEFCAIFENEEPQAVYEKLKEICEKLSNKKFYVRRADRDEPQSNRKAKLKSKVSVFLTISIGMSSKAESDLTADDIRKDADMALYKAKDLGRNRVVRSNGGDL